MNRESEKIIQIGRTKYEREKGNACPISCHQLKINQLNPNDYEYNQIKNGTVFNLVSKTFDDSNIHCFTYK